MSDAVSDLIGDLRNKQSDAETLANDLGEYINAIEEAVEDISSFEDRVDDLSIKIVDENGYNIDADYTSYDDYEHELRIDIGLNEYFTDRLGDCSMIIVDDNGKELEELDTDVNEHGDIEVRVASVSFEASEEEVRRILNDTDAFVAKVKEVEEANFLKRCEELGLKNITDLEGLKKRLAKLAAFETLLSNND